MPKSNKSNNQLFKSSNLSLVAAILATRKAKLVGSKKVSPYKFEFYLSPVGICQELEAEYFNDNLKVSVRSVEANIKMLKSIAKEDENGR